MHADPTEWTVLVTGGSSGLGAAVTARLAGLGAAPVVLDVRPPSDGTAFEEVDLSDTAAVEEAVARVLERTGRIDAVVTAAGVDVPAPFGKLPAAEWERIVKVNLFGTAAVIRAALPALEEVGGRVVTVASTLGHRVAGDASAYCASKWGVVGLTRALQMELRERVGLTLLTPGGMETAFFDAREETYKPPPGMRLASPDAVAEAAIFALRQPEGCEVKELVVTSPNETSYP